MKLYYNAGKLSESNLELYNNPITIKSLTLQPVVYRSLIEYMWSNKFSDFLESDLR